MLLGLATELFKDLVGQDLLAVQKNIKSQTFSQEYAMGSENLPELITDTIFPTEHIDAKTQFPKWLQDRSDDLSTNSKLIKLTQHYYDWLYSFNGSGYVLDDKFDDVFNVDRCPEQLLLSYLKNYFSLPDEVLDILEADNIRQFLSNVRGRFVSQQGNKLSVGYLFNTLFGASEVQILFLDNAKCELTVFFQDDVMPTGEVFDKMILAYKQLIHPVGVELISSAAPVNQDSFIANLRGGGSGGFSGDIPQFTAWEELTYGDGAYDGTGTGEEISIIGNYLLYTLDDTTSIPGTAGCSGSTLHGGITGGATGNTYTNMTTYAFPDWSTAVTIAGTSFGLINIYDFAYLSAASGNTSPNDGRETNSACPAGGYS